MTAKTSNATDVAGQSVRVLADAAMQLGTAGIHVTRATVRAMTPLTLWARANPAVAAVRLGVTVVVAATVYNAAFGHSAAHPSPWFGSVEQDVARQETEPQTAPVAAPKRARIADPVVFGIQSELTDRGFYEGEIDGLSGERTRAAIVAYEQSVGIPARGQATSALLDRIRLGNVASVPRPGERDETATGSVPAATDDAEEGPNLVLLAQRGLVAYGGELATDGVMGPMTRAAIEEFEGAHGMPITGEPSETLVAKMRANGLL